MSQRTRMHEEHENAVEIREEPIGSLAAYCEIPIGFEVMCEFIVTATPAGFDLVERPVEPWTKDYDSFGGNSPEVLPRRFDIGNWAILSAWVEGERIGGALLAWRTPAIELLEARDDLVVVWDLRVRPEHRGIGVGRALWQHAERWASDREAAELKVETQHTNVPACRFYQRMGCELRAANPRAYEDAPEDIQLLWYKDLAPGRAV